MSKNKQNTSIPNKELFSRMNFLYQASMLMAKQSNCALSAYYGRQCQSIGKKAQLRISPDVKRNFCKRCALAQQPGTTTDLEILSHKRKKSKRKKKANAEEDDNIDFGADVFIRCRKCSWQRKLIVNPKYDFWLEKTTSVEEITAQTIECTKKNCEFNNGLKDRAKETQTKEKDD